MSRLPVVSGQDAVRAFAKLGYAVDHQTGSHIILRQQDPPHRRSSPGGRTSVARGFEPLECEPRLLSPFFFPRPEGGRSSLEDLVLVELNPVPAQQLKKLRLEVHALVMFLLPRDVRFDFRHAGFAYGKAAIALLP